MLSGSEDRQAVDGEGRLVIGSEGEHQEEDEHPIYRYHGFLEALDVF